MPHLVIEYARKLEETISIPALVSAAQEAMNRSGLFASHTIKTRALAYDHFIAGDKGGSFIHAEIQLLEGHSDREREALSSAVFNCLCQFANGVPAVTVEVREVDASCYAKRLPF
ncbi:5-carboxymethyl-2-hydroxymuconate Delta-isomerase [Microbulbifer thermotolerans]|uniref:5-carboxymethyl-2-hydroxymuconate delta-isomerase n=1 Tax=Microbulbifer thermotolerans TaxID=252514 RepID=A0A143HK77_MICTH|nr:5-carboxymethyl-2-hydroxymuconate delta-isomerase [Microbulbifer thermotolerans]AMX02129.1 5-carboxymethyl-2-hydroxymuconate delta-isomerase [Microbulbifer thermotolerans]MCX2778909.1 5-carboxymethyl-2-hydroxymuconate delta-isomerase [Microbulbifer thermotolerans]MCX2781459.1 5-carboxymethyl-2-hydroxymuconate delta-isomerase [Microbulbifer thermotolerans]MCX2793795.1 5-carboxymethyl-2-hydroxymuconate delta-isomerase [Microbulbifer thermotolerans]MCX2802355.1 5-carboxymethyl-2-hydroxymuconat